MYFKKFQIFDFFENVQNLKMYFFQISNTRFFLKFFKQKMYFLKFQKFDFFENGQIKNVFFPNYAFKTSPEMLLRRDYQHNTFENLRTQTLNSNTKHLRSKHYSPRRAWVPTL